MQHKLILLRCTTYEKNMVDVSRGNYRPGKLGCGESRLYGKRAVGKTARVGSVTWGT